MQRQRIRKGALIYRDCSCIRINAPGYFKAGKIGSEGQASQSAKAVKCRTFSHRLEFRNSILKLQASSIQHLAPAARANFCILGYLLGRQRARTALLLQAVINIGVVIGLLPTKGLPLPFISAGGSSLIISLLEIGVLYNIALHAHGRVGAAETQTIKDRVHQF